MATRVQTISEVKNSLGWGKKEWNTGGGAFLAWSFDLGLRLSTVAGDFSRRT
jgi:hypothetical protein